MSGAQRVDTDSRALLVVGGRRSTGGGGRGCDSEAVAGVHEGRVAHQGVDLLRLAAELGLELGDLVCIAVELLVLFVTIC